MKYPIKIENINSSVEFFDEIVPLIKESKEYLGRQKWCKGIHNGWLFTNIGYALNIFLYKIENEQSPEDNLLWVMVGDIPSIYLDTYGIKSTKEVVENYIELANDWIFHAESGQSLDECFPLEAQNSSESIKMLKTRIQFIRDEMLQNISEDMM
ncbi:MAG TPA: DUF4826 family protein [Chitinophagaceae bacterium]|jgi:hypothetical protein|nr:DUF4826 family protein [Chitinophagaceae bacterium]